METTKYFSRTIQFLKSLSTNTKTEITNSANVELTYNRFGIISKNVANAKKASNSLLPFMYSDENEALFI